MHPITLYLVIAAAPGANSGFNFTGIQGVLAIIGGLVAMYVGIRIMGRGNKGDFKGAAESGGAVLIGVIIFALGVSFVIASRSAGHFVNFLLS